MSRQVGGVEAVAIGDVNSAYLSSTAFSSAVVELIDGGKKSLVDVGKWTFATNKDFRLQWTPV